MKIEILFTLNHDQMFIQAQQATRVAHLMNDFLHSFRFLSSLELVFFCIWILHLCRTAGNYNFNKFYLHASLHKTMIIVPFNKAAVFRISLKDTGLVLHENSTK